MKCAACGANTSYVYKCDKCGEIRCTANNKCPGTFKNHEGSAASSSFCHSCKKGKMIQIK